MTVLDKQTMSTDKISQALSPTSQNSIEVSMMDVVSHYGIIGMAIGVAIGIAGKEFIFSLSNDVALPLLGNLWKGNRFLSKYTLDWNKFFGTFLTFVIVFGVIMIVLKSLLSPIVETEIRKQKAEAKVKRVYDDQVLENQDKLIHSLLKNTEEIKRGNDIFCGERTC